MFRFANTTLGVFACVFASSASADLAVVAVDNHTAYTDGVMGPAKFPQPDLISLVDLKSSSPKLVRTIEVPTSVRGAPAAVWVAPDESWAIVTSATTIDPLHSGHMMDDNRVSIIDLKASSPHVLQTIEAGKGANAIAVSPDRKLAIVTNRVDGTLSVFSISDKRLSPLGVVDLGNAQSLPSGLKFLPDGKTALVALYGDDSIGILKINDQVVSLEKQRIVTGVNPYMMDVSRDGKMAVVGNMGGGTNGEINTVSLIDLSTFRTADTIAVPSLPEGVRFSPDSRFVAVASICNTTEKETSPIYHDHGELWMLQVVDRHLRVVAKGSTGRWSQGVTFSRDGKLVLVDGMMDHGLNVFHWDGTTLAPDQTVDVKGGAAATGTSW